MAVPFTCDGSGYIRKTGLILFPVIDALDVSGAAEINES